MTALRIATRASELAMWQARHVAHRIERELARRTELVPLKTEGDRRIDLPLSEIGGKALFTKEIEEALLDGRADLAVHSSKDLPAESPPELVLAAFPERADPRDALVSLRRGSLDALPQGARVGTGSARRRAQLLHRRPDLEIVPLRGNVPTRLAKLERERLDAVVLACAGLDRLGLGDRIAERIAPEWLLPAVGQGALALQVRRGDPDAAAIARLGDPATERTVRAERAAQRRLGADCFVPLAAHATTDGARIALRLRLLSMDGVEQIEVEGDAEADGAETLGRELAERALAAGGAELLARLRAEAPA